MTVLEKPLRASLEVAHTGILWYAVSEQSRKQEGGQAIP